MSSAVKTKPETPTQRAASAVKRMAETLQLEDSKRLSFALTIAAAEYSQVDDVMASRVQAIYKELAPGSVKTGSSTRDSSSSVEDDLVPIKTVEGRYIDPAGPPNPYFLLELYGDKQLARALNRYTAPRLRLAVKEVQAQNPGTKPKSGSKQAMIDYIVTLLLPLDIQAGE